MRHAAAALRTGLAAGFALLLAACESINPATGEKQFTPLMSPSQEKQVGAQQHPKIVQQFGGVYDDPALGGYIAQIGGTLAANSELPDLAFRFTLLDSPIPNAFALPGGYVYVTRGLLALMNTEAELAGVLAHEIGHVTARHSAQRYNRAVFAQLAVGLLGAATGSDALAQLGGIAGQGYLAQYSQDQEYEADALGIRYMSRAGYNPLGQADLLSSLARQADLGGRGEDAIASFFASHPSSDERVARAVGLARQTGAPPDAPYRREAYLRTIDGMVYGGSPEHGYVRGRDFAHPKLRIAFTAPEGFKLVNQPDAVYAVGPNGASMTFDIAPAGGYGDPLQYLRRGWAAQIEKSGLERIEVSGLPGATGFVRGNTRQGPVEARFVALRRDGGAYYRLLFISRLDDAARLRESFQRATYSFRRLSAAEASGLRPRRIRIVTVGAGDTVDGFASRMVVDENPEGLFRVLNGLNPGDRLRPGEWVKLVVE